MPEIIHYQPDSSIRLEVRMEGETVWLTKAQMAMLFGCSIDNISFAAHLFPLSHSVARTIPQANAVSGRNLHRRPMRYGDTSGNACVGPLPDASPGRRQSPVGQRHPATAMFR